MSSVNRPFRLDVNGRSVIKCLSQCSFALNGDPSELDVRDGKILRIRPLHYDSKYTREEIRPWRIEKEGKSLEPLLKAVIAPYQLAYKKRVYSPNRIKYPLKRVDWNPCGERNPQNRGISKYRRISWDEASTLIADEIKRIKKQYGPYAVLCHGDGHGETKTIHGPHGCQMLLMDRIGGYTLAVRNADSWEGWYWGAQHVWGGQKQCGLMTPADNLLNDITQHSELLIHIGSDLETTPWGFSGQFPSRVLYFWTSIGKKQVFISPDLNYSGAVHADKWIPILPNTDVALLLAIAYTWIKEGTYDKAYVETHVVGFEQFSDYVLGKEDGTAKTPAWASAKCGVPEWTIKALARDWAARVTSTIHFYGGSYIRGPYSHEPARLEACLLGMQGLGKPGIHSYIKMGGDPPFMSDTPKAVKDVNRSGIRNNIWSGSRMLQLMPQSIPKTQVHHAILNPPVSSMGSTILFAPAEDQFKKYTYPIPAEKGGTEIHMIWMDNPCRTTCWNDGNLSIEAFRSPKIETIVVQHPWLENDTVFADIILPTNTKIEEEDIALMTVGIPLKGISLEEQAVQPVGESMSDYEAVGEVAKKLGLYTEYTGGMTVQEKIRKAFEGADLEDMISWEDFKKKKYFMVPTAEDWENVPAGFRLFYEDPVGNPLETPSGKLEFYSKRLAEHFPDDEERSPLPKWIEKGITHDERISSQRAVKYPLLMMSNHGRWRTHAQNDDITWTREIPTCKVRGWDGYMYEPVWINPRDAAKRGIKNGDIVKVFNERGIVLGGAIVWERIIAGAVSMDHGARVDPIAAGPEEYIDRGGAINLITPRAGTSRNCWGMATSGFLVDVEKVTMSQIEDWKGRYPKAFSREYGPAAGLRFNSWVV
ncbi:MAG: molybdopterin-dependent oxidoreductase [Dehalococcoidales bacterium]|nr:molybdopterin-dependent oxidoreductase [Dehalococcoidales bacterium]